MGIETFAGLGHAFSQSRLRRQLSFGPNPGNLKMYVYRPEALAGVAPLLVMLHGCRQTAPGYDHGAGWSALAARFGFILLAPEQSRANNINRCFNWFLPDDATRDHGEAASIRQMIATAVHQFHANPARIYITGLSAGGAMANAMLATYPEIFAGGALIAGLPYGIALDAKEALATMRSAPALSARALGDRVRQASSHQGPRPRLTLWHGDADRTVDVSNLEAILAQWRDVHGLADDPRQETIGLVRRRAWMDRSGRPVIEANVVNGLAHGAPIHAQDSTGVGDAGAPFILDAGVSSSLKIAEFFGLDRHIPAICPQAPPRAETRSRPAPSGWTKTLRALAARMRDAIRGAREKNRSGRRQRDGNRLAEAAGFTHLGEHDAPFAPGQPDRIGFH